MLFETFEERVQFNRLVELRNKFNSSYFLNHQESKEFDLILAYLVENAGNQLAESSQSPITYVEGDSNANNG